MINILLLYDFVLCFLSFFLEQYNYVQSESRVNQNEVFIQNRMINILLDQSQSQSQERFIIFCSHIKTNQRKGRYTTTEGKKQEGTK